MNRLEDAGVGPLRLGGCWSSKYMNRLEDTGVGPLYMNMLEGC